MWMPGDAAFKAKLNRDIITRNVDSHPVGRQLSADARKSAIDHGASVWQGQMGNGAAAEIGIKHATKGALKD